MDPYTTIVRAKQELNDGRLPPMLPIPAKARRIIDPAFTPGLGALEEDPEKGLRCPVRGCGVYRHRLVGHLESAHRAVGGARAVRVTLSIPDTAILVSRWARSRASETAKKIGKHVPARETWRQGYRKGGGGKRGPIKAARTAGWKNMRNSCAAQVAHRIIDVRNQIGRTPTQREATLVDHGGSHLVYAAKLLYGTWNAALATCGLRPRMMRGWELGTVLDCLEAWRAAHRGRLPSKASCGMASIPMLPSWKVIRARLGGRNWRETMQIAATALGPYVPTQPEEIEAEVAT